MRELLEYVRGGKTDRQSLEQLFGREEVQRAFAQGLLAENPWTEFVEVAEQTKDFYP